MKRSASVPSGIAYSKATVSDILQLPLTISGCPSNSPIPKASDGEIVIYYGGWSVNELLQCKVGRRYISWRGFWDEDKVWPASPGYYRLNLRFPGSNNKTWRQQLEYLRSSDQIWKPAQVIVAATACLVHLANTGTNPICDDESYYTACRCAEPLFSKCRSAITIDRKRILLHSSAVNGKEDYVWLAAAQKC